MRRLLPLLFILYLLAGMQSSHAQSSMSLYSMPNQPASLGLNPAWVPKDKFVVGLPFVSDAYFQSRSNDFVLSSLLQPNPDSASLDLIPANIADHISANNFQNIHLSWQWLSVGMRLGEKNFLTFSIRERLNFRSYLSVDLVRLAGLGNEIFQNETADLGSSVHFDWYREYGLRLARQVSDKLNIGAQVKLIDGISNIHTESNNYSASFDGDYYDFELNGSALFQTAGMTTITRNDSFRLFSTTPLRGVGSGFGLNLGLDYSVNENLRFSASVVNLGRIAWKQDVKQIQAQTDSFSFQGFDILDLIDDGFGDSTNSPGMDVRDSLKSILSLDDDNAESYSTTTPWTLYLSASHKINEKLSLAGVYAVESGYGRSLHAFSLALPIAINEQLRIHPSYTLSSGGFANIGFSASYSLKILQLYLATDNIPGMFLPQDTKLGHAQAGIYLTF